MTRHSISFERTVDAVADLGLDPDEGTVVDDALAAVDPGTRVEFPTGRYLIDSCWIRSDNVGLVAADGANPVFVPAEPTADSEDWTLLLKTGGDHVVSGFEFDFTQEGYGGSLRVMPPDGDFHIQDVRVRGIAPDSVDGLAVAVDDPDGVGTVERFYARDGSGYDSSSHGIFVADSHTGRLNVVDCEVWNWSDNGLYASSPGYVGSYNGTETNDRGDGEVHVLGGVYKNNNIANVRIGTTGSSVKEVTIVNERNPSGDTWDSRGYDIMPRSGSEPDPVVNARGIWLTNRTGLLVEDCDINMEAGRASGAVVVGNSVGAAVVRDTRIRVTSSDVGQVISVGSPDIQWDDTHITFSNVSVTGYGGSRGAAVRVRGRGGTVFDACCLKLDADGQHGVVFEDGAGRFEDTRISCSGEPVVGADATNVTAADSCPLPDTGGR
ncbi:hypothetical protein C474_15434 [Halogeometricum pallidum JCM 14848]|uniref:Right handed beta helix domain-containing protein n=1 Tax=Halogeometricum pallidum JCM 14848 TaxID=1227487 RepID=M0CZ69_HALPD|nr:hypothetical protein [Halogeometricum pallidum]ELZ28511.1 hypothetical protein C474_15434 [Halogeometricum pallidum JCM 14848]